MLVNGFIVGLGFKDFVTPCLIFLTFISYIIFRFKRPTDFPPGPPCFPPLWNMRTVQRKTLVGAFREWREKYGDVFSVFLGTNWIIVINGIDNLKEAFIDRADVFSGRPDLFVNRYINEKRGIIGTEGQAWKELKRFTLGALKNFGFGRKNIEDRIKEEVSIFIESMDKTNGNNFRLDEKVNISVSNIICSIVFGKRYDYSDQKFLRLMKMLDDYISNSTLTTTLNFMPILKHIPGDMFSAKRVLSNQRDIEHFIQARIDEHRNSFEPGRLRDFVDAGLAEIPKNGGHTSSIITEHQIRKIIRDLFIAGTETSATCIKWFILYMIHYPEVQERMADEIHSIMGTNHPSFDKRVHLPYCEAVIHETLRIGNIAPLSVLHGASRDIIFKQWRIPRGSVIVPSLDSVLKDEQVFPHPEIFNPERFLDANGKLCATENNVAFSLGRRSCLGESLARMELFHFFTALVQRFKFLPAEGENPPAIERILGLQFSPAPFTLRVVRRYS